MIHRGCAQNRNTCSGHKPSLPVSYQFRGTISGKLVRNWGFAWSPGRRCTPAPMLLFPGGCDDDTQRVRTKPKHMLRPQAEPAGVLPVSGDNFWETRQKLGFCLEFAPTGVRPRQCFRSQVGVMMIHRGCAHSRNTCSGRKPSLPVSYQFRGTISGNSQKLENESFFKNQAPVYARANASVSPCVGRS